MDSLALMDIFRSLKFRMDKKFQGEKWLVILEVLAELPDRIYMSRFMLQVQLVSRLCPVNLVLGKFLNSRLPLLTLIWTQCIICLLISRPPRLFFESVIW